MNSTTKTCIICDKSYSTIQKAEVAAKIARETLGKLPNHPDVCLTCIQEARLITRDSIRPELDKACIALNEAKQALQKATLAKQALENRHRDADQQASWIKFFIQQAEWEKRQAIQSRKPAKRKPSKKARKSVSKQTAIINALLASMSPEQRSAIESSIAKL